LNKICKPFTAADSFFMIRQFQFTGRGAVTLYGKRFSFSWAALCAVASPISFYCANFRNDFDGLRSTDSEMSINILSLSLDGLPTVFRIEQSGAVLPHFVTPTITLLSSGSSSSATSLQNSFLEF
jgi:hypothetical protein